LAELAPLRFALIQINEQFHDYQMSVRYEGIAIGGNFMDKLDPDANTFRLYVATATETFL
jgi:hypothetical protein